MPYLIPDTESPSLATMGSHMCCNLIPDTESPSLAIMGITHVPYLFPDTESPSLDILWWSQMCHILSQTFLRSPSLGLLWGHTCAVILSQTVRVTIASYYGVTHVPYLIPDTESPSLATMGSHMCCILSQTQSHHR